MRIIGGDLIIRYGIRARWWVLIGALIGLATGGALYVTSPPTFSARIVVELTDVPAGANLTANGGTTRSITIDTDAQLVLSDPVLEAVAAEVGRDVDDVAAAIQISARPLTRVLVLGYRDRTAAEAEAGARVAAETFLAERERVLLQPLRAYFLEVTETHQAEPTIVGEGAEARPRVFPRPVLDNPRQRAVEAALALPGPGEVVEGGPRPTAERGQIEISVISGLAFGSLVGLGLGVAWARRREAVRPGFVVPAMAALR